ncbi:MAG: O-antigen ligase family protein [Verrucomicrobia bacterium]|nr:O-antigen ligase family protein [Verrucomicrobiota bacterium]MDA1085414.1 O-antigen ligase family protein [Verrucomicrobiota bacterium]
MSRAWVIIIAAIAVCIWGFGGENILFVAPASILVLVAFLLVATPSAIRAFCLHMRGQSWCLPAGAMMVLAVLLLPFSANRYIALVECAYALVLGAAFVIAALLSARDATRLTAGVVLVVTACAVYGFVQQAGLADSTFWHNGHYASRFVNSAHFATLLAAAIFLGGALAVQDGPPLTRLIGALGVPINGVGLLMTGARAAWLAAAVMALAAGILICLQRPQGGRRRYVGVVAVILLALAGLTAGLVVSQGGVGERIRDLTSLRAAGVGQRLLLWREAQALIADNPLGVGAGGFGERYLQYALASDRYIAYRAHNEVLQLIAELGWITIPLLLAFCVASMRSVLVALRSGPSALTIGVLGALGVFALHSLVDFPLRLRANSLAAATLAGVWVALRAGPDSPGLGRRPSVLVSATMRIVAGVLILGWVAIGVSNRYAKSGLRELEIIEFDRALDHLERSARWMPIDPDVAYATGRALYAKSTFAPAVRKRQLLEAAGDAFHRASRIAPYRTQTQIRIAWVRREMGQPREAEVAFRRAIELDATLGIWRFYYADFLMTQRRYHDAAAAYRAGLERLEDSGAYTPRSIYRRLYDASSDLDVVRAACPDTPRDRAQLEKFIQEVAPSNP